ncbi:MAG TPA: ABC transporter substrate-binding protein [Desulfobacterales bacterium]|nr:ABC transporter substrate-binding protein [Desulfobacterales bacterium]
MPEKDKIEARKENSEEIEVESKKERPMLKTWSWFLIIIIVICLGIWSYFIFIEKEATKKYVGPIEKVTFGSSTTHKIGAVFVAKDKDYFEEEGIDLEIKQFGSGKASFLAMLKGESVDISAVADTPIVFSSFNREDFQILAGMYTSYDDKVIARKDKGINSIADLQGKKVGLTKGTNAQFVLDLLLNYKGILSSKVEVVDIKPMDLVTALANGDVDAISAWEPIPFEAEQVLQDKAIKFINDGYYRKIFYFALKKDFVKNHPETLKRFLRAIYKANTFLKEYEDESQAIVAEALNLGKEAVRRGWKEGEFTIFLDQALIVSLEDQARWAMRNKVTDATDIPNYIDFIYPDALYSVQPEAVTIIR